MAGRQDVRRLLALEAADRRGMLSPTQQMALRTLEARMRDRDPLEGVKAAGQTAASIASSAIAEPVSGLVGLAALPFGADVATRAIERTQEGMTYQPTSERSQGQMQDIGQAMQPVGELFSGISQYAGDAAYEATGSPAAAAAAYSAPTAALELLGLNIARRLPTGKQYQMGDIGAKGPGARQMGAVGGVRSAPESAKDLMASWKERGINSFVGETGDALRLNKIVVPQAARESGMGTQAMQELVDYADRAGKRIDLSPTSDFGGNRKRLKEFYERFGFVENKGKAKDYEVSESMYRPPQGKRSGQ